jgi:hypothetical protein
MTLMTSWRGVERPDAAGLGEADGRDQAGPHGRGDPGRPGQVPVIIERCPLQQADVRRPGCGVVNERAHERGNGLPDVLACEGGKVRDHGLGRGEGPVEHGLVQILLGAERVAGQDGEPACRNEQAPLVILRRAGLWAGKLRESGCLVLDRRAVKCLRLTRPPVP